MLLILQQSIQDYIFSGTYNISSISDFKSAKNQKIEVLNLLEDLDFIGDDSYSRITVPKIFEGNGHTIKNIYYQTTSQNQLSLFTFLQQGNKDCHTVTIRNLNLLNITLVSTYSTQSQSTTFSAGIFFSNSNHETQFSNITITNSSINLQGHTPFDMVGGLIGLNWGYPMHVEQTAIQLEINQRKPLTDIQQDNETQTFKVYNKYYAGVVGYNHGTLDIENTDVQFVWNCNSTYDHNLVAGITGMQKKQITANYVAVQFTVYAYQSTGSEFSGFVANANNQTSDIKYVDILMRGNNYRSMHTGFCGRNWSNLVIETLQSDVLMWNNSISYNGLSVNNIVPSIDENDTVAQCKNCCGIDYGFSLNIALEHCYNEINTYLEKDEATLQGLKDCVPEKVNILCDTNALCQIRQFGFSQRMSCECYSKFKKNVNNVCQGIFEEVEQEIQEASSTQLVQTTLDPVTISIACVIGALCLLGIGWLVWIIKNKDKFDGKKKPKAKKQKKQPKKETPPPPPPKQKDDTSTQNNIGETAKDMQYYSNNATWRPRRQINDYQNKYYDNNTTLQSKYVSKLKPVQM